MKKNKKVILAVCMGVLYVVLLGASAVLTVFGLQTQKQQEEAAQNVERLQLKRDVRTQELEQLQSDVAVLTEQSAALETKAEEPAEEAVEPQEETAGPQEEQAEGELEPGTSASGIDNLPAGAIIAEGQVNLFSLDNYFKSYEIVEGDEVYNRIIGKSYQVNDNIGLGDLRYVKLLHYNFDGEIQVGELIVNAALTEDYISAFRQLFENKYQIQSMYLVDNYWTGDADSTDTASIEENNTSCFNYRSTTVGQSLSKHAYGCAIDINPQQNPYVWFSEDGSPTCTHENAVEYLDRTTGAAHVITHEDLCYQVFASLGFTWGGDWSSPIDYQHFEKTI